MAARTSATSIEDFAKELVNYLIENHSQISAVNVDVDQKAWTNIIMSNNIRHPTSFVQSSNEQQTTTVRRSRHGSFKIVSGLKDLKVMKTAHSSFVQFYRDKLTTLPDADDRLFGTSIRAEWSYDEKATIIDFAKMRQQIRSTLVDMFAEHHSDSVQHTLHDIGKFILDRVPVITKIHMTLPNIHCLPVDLTRFGEENKNEIFMPIDDPHGYIQCSIVRPSAKESPRSKL